MISTSSAFGSASWKFAQIVVSSAPTVGVPHVARLLGVAHPVGHAGPVVDRFRTQRRIRHLATGQRPRRSSPVQVHVAEMLLRRVLARVDDPVPVDLLGERVERRRRDEFGTVDLPDCPADRLPPGQRLRALDDDVLTRGSFVGDAALVAQPAAPGPHPLAVLALVDDDGVPRLGHPRPRG